MSTADKPRPVEGIVGRELEPFVVRHYSGDERPTIKGNGFDGLEIGTDREEAEAFVAFINARMQPPNASLSGASRKG